MLLPCGLLTLVTLSTALPIPRLRYSHAQDVLFYNYLGFASDPVPSTARIPTAYESAIEARRILSGERYGVLSTIFPSSTPNEILLPSIPHPQEKGPHAYENRPSSVRGLPVGLPEYIADCEGTGDPTLLAISISTSAKNWAAGSNVSLAITSHDGSGRDWRSQAANPRYTLFGYVASLSTKEVEAQRVQSCFLQKHPDAKYWLPGNSIHESYWARVVVTEVYWIGGFGDRAYIGWISGDDWRRAGTQMLDAQPK